MADTKAISGKGDIKVTDKSVDLASPSGLVDFAKTLKTFILSEKLYTPIQGKNYVNVEGWQFAGAATGVFPIVKSVERIETADAKEIKYRAEVQLKRLADGSVVGYGVSICSNRESKRTSADEYVIASMAQTRATGKAYRNAFAWLMKMAGYEATPSEEMDSGGSTSPTASINTQDLQAKVNKAKTTAELRKIQESLPHDIRGETVDMFVSRLREMQDNGAV